MIKTTILLLILFILVIFIGLVIITNKDSWIENEKRFNKEFTEKTVKKMLHILNNTKGV